jgi:Ni/Co efflux regulator RcnB
MKRVAFPVACALALFVAGTLAAGPVLADKPAWAGGGDKRESKGNKGKGHRDRGGDRGQRGGDHFTDQHRVVIREYYTTQFRGGHCPPGLAKKNNGCMPPGQAKKWAVGRPLPHEVVYYDLPPALVVKIGLPPSGYRYVRVAGDILMIAVGTGLVVSAIEDLGRM